MAVFSATSAMCLASTVISPSAHSATPVRRLRARMAARKSLEARERDRRYCAMGDEVASLIACLIVAMVTLASGFGASSLSLSLSLAFVFEAFLPLRLVAEGE